MKKNIDGNPDWFITDEGKVFHGDKEIHPYKNNKYLCFEMDKKRYFLAREMAKAFLQDGDKHFQLEYLDGNTYNCSLDNLRIRKTVSKKTSTKATTSYTKSRPTRFYCDETGNEYESTADIAEDLGISLSDVFDCRCNTQAGYRTKYHIRTISQLTLYVDSAKMKNIDIDGGKNFPLLRLGEVFSHFSTIFYLHFSHFFHNFVIDIILTLSYH